MDYSIQGKYRNLLMGIATLMIVVFHTDFLRIGNFDLIRKKMDIGVDIFFFLSGFGLFYSWKINNHIITFWKKRLIRIYPSLIIVVVAFTLFERVFHHLVYGDANSIILITGFNFFVSNGNLLYWFISSIIAIYILAPLYLNLFNKSTKLVSLLALLVCALLIIFDIYYHQSKYLIFFTRIPSFIIGVYFGHLGNCKCKIRNRKIYVQLLFICIFSLGLWDYFYAIGKMVFFVKYIIFTVMTPCFIMSSCYVLDYFFGKAELLYRTMNYLGKISLEVYLVYEMLRNIFNPILKETMNYDSQYIIYAIILFLITTVFADCVKRISECILKLQIFKSNIV